MRISLAYKYFVYKIYVYKEIFSARAPRWLGSAGTAQSRAAPKRSVGPAKPVDGGGAMWPRWCAAFISEAIIRISYKTRSERLR